MVRFTFVCVACVGFALAAKPADPPEPVIAKESYRRAVEADIAFLGKALDAIESAPRALDGRVKASKGVAALLMRYADALGDDTQKTRAVRIVALIDAKDWKGAAAASKRLKDPGPEKPPPKAVPQFRHAELFAPFRGQQTGGLGIDRDIKDMTKATTKVDVKLAELIGVRTAVLMELAEEILQPDNETIERWGLTKPANWRLWLKWLRDSKVLAREVAVEAAKGDAADHTLLKKLLTNLNARCTDCHSRPCRE
jgi:hypothetical protein